MAFSFRPSFLRCFQISLSFSSLPVAAAATLDECPRAIRFAINVDTQSETAFLFQPANFGQATINAATDLVHTIVKIEPLDSCSAITNGPEVDGNIALVVRGSCPFSAKVTNAMAAGAVAVVVVNTADELFEMGGGDGDVSDLVPSIMVTSSAGAAIEQVLPSLPLPKRHRRPAPTSAIVTGFHIPRSHLCR